MWMGPGCGASPEAGRELSRLEARLAVAAREAFVFAKSKLLCAQDFFPRAFCKSSFVLWFRLSCQLCL